MGELISLQAAKEERTPHLRGPAICLACHYDWEAVTPVGVFNGLACPNCGLRRGIFQGLVIPETVFVCFCGNSLFFVVPDGCQCANCGLLAKGF